MKRVLISFCDSSNLGDLLIVEELEKIIQLDAEVSTLSFNLESKDKKHKNSLNVKNESKENKVLDFYKKKLRRLLLFDFIHFIKHKYDIKKYNWENFDKEIQNSDMLIIGGGNTIFGTTKMMSSTDKVLKIINYAKANNKKVFLCSVGIGPFKSKRQLRLLDEILSKSDYITVRDEISLSYLEKYKNKVDLTVDPVLFLNKFKNSDTHNNIIGICVMDIRLNKMSQKEYEMYIANLVKIINQIRLKLPDTNVILYSTEIKDYIAVNDVNNKINDEKVDLFEVNNMEELKTLYSTLDVILGTRMHSLIIGFSQDIPIVGLSWQPKMIGFFKQIDQIQSVFDINEIEEKNTELLNLIMEKFNNLDWFIKQNQKKKKELEALYLINSKFLSEEHDE